jgi:hypothetical protein
VPGVAHVLNAVAVGDDQGSSLLVSVVFIAIVYLSPDSLLACRGPIFKGREETRKGTIGVVLIRVSVLHD